MYTTENIEDWDFRNWQSILNRNKEDIVPDARHWEADRFLQANFTYVLAVESLRLTKLRIMLDQGDEWATLSDDKMDVLLTPLGAETLKYTTSWRDVFTSTGRFNRRITKALIREWEKNGRLRVTFMPLDMEKQFPGLFAN